MKKFVFILALTLGFGVQAQEASKAQKLLNEVSSKVKNYDNMVIEFKYSLVNELTG